MPLANLPALKNPVSLERLAYNTLKDAILSFQLLPGDALVEADLAHQLGISKTPVRDALLRLEKEGLVVKIPYTGVRVAEINQRTLIEIFQIRSALEGLSAFLAVTNFYEADVQQAQGLIAAHQLALESGDIEQASRINRMFHDLLIQRSQNQRLADILANLDDHLRRYRLLSFYQKGRPIKSVNEHRAVLHAIEAHDPKAAEQAMNAHLLSVLQDLESEDVDSLIEHIRSGRKPVTTSDEI